MIAARPQQFYDKRVTLTGCVTTDGIERTVLIDRTCPYTGIRTSQSAKLRPDQRFLPTIKSDVCGTFTCTFRSVITFNEIVVDTNVLEIDDATDLKTVTPEQGDRK